MTGNRNRENRCALLFACRPLRLASPMSKQAEPPAAPIRISTNTILNGRFINAGEPLPVERIEDLPEPLRPLVVTGEPEEPDDQPRGAFS